MNETFLQPLRTMVRLLTFRATQEELNSLDRRHLLLGTLCTWVVGMGRYWDDPRAVWAQKLGLGSLAYVVCLSVLLWIIIRPVRRGPLSFPNLLAFVSLTSPPALLYAIPVEKFMDLRTANQVNLAFLCAVAAYRVALYGFFLRRGLRLGWRMPVVLLLPLTAILFALFTLNLQHVVFNIMGGIREADQSVHDTAYQMIFVMMLLSFYILPVVGLGWLAVALRNLWEWRQERRQDSGGRGDA